MAALVSSHPGGATESNDELSPEITVASIEELILSVAGEISGMCVS
jgi:hypothetical protein